MQNLAVAASFLAPPAQSAGRTVQCRTDAPWSPTASCLSTRRFCAPGYKTTGRPAVVRTSRHTVCKPVLLCDPVSLCSHPVTFADQAYTLCSKHPTTHLHATYQHAQPAWFYGSDL